ncbi:hypothetical protein HAX54_031111 [Datura stramonium]|uniref:WEB family protein n=1 Tax=Datura stramonium TaxID=4076 RepID=A0ABS8V8N0_DATST|nr:hypothetical protein [Datura stramonium]
MEGCSASKAEDFSSSAIYISSAVFKSSSGLTREGAFSGEKSAIKKPKQHSAERVLSKETQLHLAQEELNKLNKQLKNAEDTKTHALVELEGAKQTVEDLTHKIKFVCESKDSTIKATEAAKNQVKQLEASDRPVLGMDDSSKVYLETARGKYMGAVADLDTAKQEIRKIHLDGDTAREEKAFALKQVDEAELTAEENMERAGELSKEIVAVQELIGQLKLACVQEEEEAKIYVEKDVQKQYYKARLEEAAKRLLSLRKELDPDLTKSLEAQFAETMSEVQKERDCTRSSDLDLVRAVAIELGNAKESLRKVAEEESMLQPLVEALKLELENVKKKCILISRKRRLSQNHLRIVYMSNSGKPNPRLK